MVTSQHSCFIIHKLIIMFLTFFGQQGKREVSSKQNQTRQVEEWKEILN